MIVSYFVGIITGLLFSTPPGPVVISSVKIGINKGFNNAMHLALGTALVDFSIITISILTSGYIINSINGFIINNSSLYQVLQIGLIIALSGYGIKMLLTKSDIITTDKINFQPKEHKSSFFIGFGISLTNILNPVFLSSVLLVGFYAQKYAVTDNLTSQKFLFGLGFACGSFLWLFIVNLLIRYLKSNSSNRIIILVHRIAGSGLVLSAVIVLCKVI